eukprot:TRINITY_DN443_c0_g1_i1.p1 TRINITY_DN443_c0_g1~~TRINITY_DN443_c0_g1_i1.p1  ORF type:complete len:229 (+),score=48.49 TRINITY_DN443_c0_g1_i1:76-762(+)
MKFHQIWAFLVLLLSLANAYSGPKVDSSRRLESEGYSAEISGDGTAAVSPRRASMMRMEQRSAKATSDQDETRADKEVESKDADEKALELMDFDGSPNLDQPGLIMSVLTRKCLTFKKTNGELPLHVGSCRSGSDRSWYFDQGRIRLAKDGKCLDHNTGTGAVVTADCHHGGNQQWVFVDGKVMSKSKVASGKCLAIDLTVSHKDKAILQSCDDLTQQTWALKQVVKS